MTQVEQKMIYQSGERNDIIVAAPHHGCIPRSDYYTKEVASMLAKYLSATLIVAENMRSLVDLNKDPNQAPTPETKHLCLRYQQHILADTVNLFIEIHGHVHGNYDVEISCGFLPDSNYAFDRELLSRLLSLEETLNKQLERKWQNDFIMPPPSLVFTR